MTRTITQVLADNLRYYMTEKGKTQADIASATGLGQTTISLYLSPGRRAPTASGKDPSPTLARVQCLADALGVELWELLRPLSKEQRDLIRSVDAVIAAHTKEVAGLPQGVEQSAAAKGQRRKPRRHAA